MLWRFTFTEIYTFKRQWEIAWISSSTLFYHYTRFRVALKRNSVQVNWKTLNYCLLKIFLPLYLHGYDWLTQFVISHYLLVVGMITDTVKLYYPQNEINCMFVLKKNYSFYSYMIKREIRALTFNALQLLIYLKNGHMTIDCILIISVVIFHVIGLFIWCTKKSLLFYTMVKIVGCKTLYTKVCQQQSMKILAILYQQHQDFYVKKCQGNPKRRHSNNFCLWFFNLN